jgi:hypothetical protein
MGRNVAGGELLEHVKPVDHDLRCHDLACSRPLGHGPAAASINLQTEVRVLHVLSESDPRVVSSDVQRVHCPASSGSDIRSTLQGEGLQVAAITLDQKGRPRQVVGHL